MSAIIDTPETDLWIAVIEQALFDATIGLGVRKHKLIGINGSSVQAPDIYAGRRFISGRSGALKDICDALGLDYEATREDLLSIYNACLPRMPEHWREVL